MATAVNKNWAALVRGPHNAQNAESSDQKSSTAMATAQTCESAKISRRESFTDSSWLTFSRMKRHYGVSFADLHCCVAVDFPLDTMACDDIA